MSIITIVSILVTFCALFSYLNYRFIKLPAAIGIMLMAFVLSTIIMLLPMLGVDILPTVRNIMNSIDFSETLLHGMLSFLLFAGALHVNWTTLKSQKYIISVMALFGTVFSTALVGFAVYTIFPMLGFDIPLIYALVLSLSAGEMRDFLLLVTYCIVVFSIVAQGLTIGKLVRRYN